MVTFLTAPLLKGGGSGCHPCTSGCSVPFRGLVLVWHGLREGVWGLLKAPSSVLKGSFTWQLEELVVVLNGKESLVSFFLCLPGSSQQMQSSASANRMGPFSHICGN